MHRRLCRSSQRIGTSTSSLASTLGVPAARNHCGITHSRSDGVGTTSQSCYARRCSATRWQNPHHLLTLSLGSPCRCFSTSGVIDPEEISFMEAPAAAIDHSGPSTAADENASTPSSSSSAAGLPPSVLAALSPDLPRLFTDVRRIDGFSRARVVSFLKRYAGTTAPDASQSGGGGTSAGSSSTLFEVKIVSSTVDDHDVLYHCRLFVPLRHPALEDGQCRPHSQQEHTGLWAHGVADSAKDAEQLAAMHAEYIIDELGYHIYNLPSMQRKHAEAARQAGRYAPRPSAVDEAHIARLEHFPAPLRRILHRDESERGEWQLLETDAPRYANPSHALLSPCVIDTAAEVRVRQFFTAQDLPFVQMCTCHKEEAVEKGGPAYFVATVSLPKQVLSPAATRAVEARGKAREKQMAITLACMHAELILDALSVPLYPQDDSLQKAHAMAAWGCGRTAPLPGAASKDPQHVLLPPPLKELVIVHAGGGGAKRQDSGQRFSSRSTEEELVHRHRVLTTQTTDFVDTSVCERTAVRELCEYLRRHHVACAEQPFFREEVLGRTKSTVVLPLPDRYGVRGGVGIALSAKDADVLAAMHALDVLMALGVAVKPTDTEQQGWVADRAKKLACPALAGSVSITDPSPPGRRLKGKQFAERVEVGVAEPVGPTSAQDEATPGDSSQASHSSNGSPPQLLTAPTEGQRPRRVAKRAKVATDTITTTSPKNGSGEGSETENCGTGVTDDPPLPSPAVSSGAGASPRETERSEREPASTEEAVAAHLRARATVPRDHWSLEADSPDGYIMVAPKSETSSTFATDALRSPRELDPRAKERVQLFLANVGRRFEDVFSTHYTDSDDNGGQGWHRCVAKLPLPARFGDRLALGEAALAADAEMLAAMHAELIVDALGICLFPNDAKSQRRHSVACAREGRWAALGSGEEKPPDTPSPPPLRREYVGSLHWERQKERRSRKAVPVPRRPPEPTASSSSSPTETIKASGEASNVAECDVAAGLPDGGNDDLSSFTSVLESELDLVSKARVQYYLRRQQNAAPATPPEVTYNMVMGRGVVQHVATWRLPLPKEKTATTTTEESPDANSTTEAVLVQGVASTKRDADVLSWMHAERTLDAMGIPLFDNLPRLQRWHAERVAKLGRTAPLPNGKANGFSSCVKGRGEEKSVVPPLRLAGALPKELVKPTCPTGPHVTAEQWQQYVEACAEYIFEAKLLAYNSYYDAERTPRTGDALLDATLDEAEKMPLHSDSKRLLQLYCNAAEYQYPLHWATTVTGPITHRVTLVTIPVPGHEYVRATGVGGNKEAAQRRATLHAMALLKRLDPDFDDYEAQAKQALENTKLDNNNEEVAVDGFSTLPHILKEASQLFPVDELRRTRHTSGANVVWSKASGAPTLEGKVRLLELYTVCFELPRPQVQHRVRFAEGSSVHYSTEVTVTDDDGQRWTGRGSCGGPLANEAAAYESLYHKAESNFRGFSDVVELLRMHPYLDPTKLVQLKLTDDVRTRIRALVADTPDEEEEVEAVPRTSEEPDADLASSFQLMRHSTMVQSQVEQESRQLLDRLHEKITTPAYLERYAKSREALHIFAWKHEILKAVEDHSVVIICGTTGCGKTTQVPQYILDHLTEQGRGGDCSLVITQPRRLSAVSIAQRVAAERLERVGDTCGYVIRFDARPGRHINFCTSGVLLRLLYSSPNLEGINYLIIDEIHERDMNSDFLLILLRDLVTRRPDLRVILMSATLQAKQFGVYFDGAPIINVEGYVYPVQELFLEDLVPYAEQHNVVTPQLKEAATATKQVSRMAEVMGDGFTDTAVPEGLHMAAAPTDAPSLEGTERYGAIEATTEIDYATVQFAVEQAARLVDVTHSSILVFLPGWEEISTARAILERKSQYQIISLHSSVGQEEQMQCFLPAAEGKIKLILSTNIAESGVTIDDIAAVVDVGRAKEKSFVATRGRTEVGKGESGSVSQLVTMYASRANCVQRRGRVGRTRPGVCIRLYSRQHFESLHDFQTPEMLRTPLETLCLHILALHLGDPATFLQRALEPPSAENVELAMARLNDLGATTASRKLTPLGLRLSMLPVEPSMGKVILVGAAFKCLDSALTIASVAQTDVFQTAREHRDLVRLHREDLSCGTQSDAIAAVNAYNYWATAHYQKAPAQVVYDLQQRLLSVPQLLQVSRHKRQFYDILCKSGFLTPEELASAKDSGNHAVLSRGTAMAAGSRKDAPGVFIDRSSASADALDVGLVKCVVASGLFPRIAMNYGKRLMRTKLENTLTPSTDSVVHKTGQGDIHQPFFVYNELSKSQETGKLVARELNAVPLWAVLLLGTNRMPLAYRSPLTLGVVDDWIFFQASFGVMELTCKLRRTLSNRLSRKFTDPHDANNNTKLEEIRLVLKELVNSSVRPNDLVDDVWSEKGKMIKAEAKPPAKSPPPQPDVENGSPPTVSAPPVATDTAQ